MEDGVWTTGEGPFVVGGQSGHERRETSVKGVDSNGNNVVTMTMSQN